MNAAEHPVASKPRRRRIKRGPSKPPAARALGRGASAQASQRAAAVLEVLAGERTPRQAALALAMSVNHFYLLERKALAALVAACERQPKGPAPPSPQEQVQALQAELARCQRECQRQAALVRATQRAVGLPAAPSQPPAKTGSHSGKPVRRRRASVRALRHARIVRANSAGLAQPGELQPTALPLGPDPSPRHQQETEHG
jgi:hypothetical protein